MSLDSKDAKTIIDDAGVKAGWDDRIKLDLACQFIDGLIGGVDRFERFIAERVAEDEAEEAEYQGG